MELEGVSAVAMSSVLLKVTWQVDDSDGFERTFLKMLHKKTFTYTINQEQHSASTHISIPWDKYHTQCRASQKWWLSCPLVLLQYIACLHGLIVNSIVHWAWLNG